MSGFALVIVLTAALLHASWNALVKAASDRAVVLAAVSSMHALLGLALVLFAPLPARESWPISPFRRSSTTATTCSFSIPTGWAISVRSIRSRVVLHRFSLR
ncbi:hypothetical protein [Pseudaminobacter salicylatoxidans]|uniref:hypothetical protein n=1 Tax=Pseudaminobacter salicylatoxidans TaxID=93369 RepID=UPI0018E09D7B|nr:hypothetical protein [Pseudaminobacter salicylatoxidans]